MCPRSVVPPQVWDASYVPGRRFKSRAGQLVAVRNSSPGRSEPCEENLVAVAGSCGGLMVKQPWPLLEISLSDICGLTTLNINAYLPIYFRNEFVYSDFCRWCPGSQSRNLLNQENLWRPHCVQKHVFRRLFHSFDVSWCKCWTVKCQEIQSTQEGHLLFFSCKNEYVNTQQA